MNPESSKATRAVRAALQSDRQHGAVVPPLYLASNFTFAGFDRKRPYDYTRTANPTRDALGEAIAELEGGTGSVITASGMAAVTLAVHLLEPGDRLLAPHDCYGGTFRLLQWLADKGHFRVQFLDQSDPQVLAQAAATLTPRLVWVETPSNPLLRITDIREVRRLFPEAILLADNTFLSPVLQRPLDLGADLVLHSTTKYLNGHSDVVGGALVAADADLHQELAAWANCLGLTGSPFDSFLALRGVRTLFARMRAHEENASTLVRVLVDHPAVSQVYYPGLQDHPGHATARRQQRGFGAMISFRLAGERPSVRKFLESLSLFSLAESLGGVESLVAHPTTMTHASMTPEARRRAGIDDRLIRLSVGIEDARDLASDLRRALDLAYAEEATPISRPFRRVGAG